jgi:hypothetical protein
MFRKRLSLTATSFNIQAIGDMQGTFNTDVIAVIVQFYWPITAITSALFWFKLNFILV